MNVNQPHNQLLAFVADTQAPMFVETILLKPFKNRKATDLIFLDISRLQPNSFFLLGDVVNLGYSDRQWRRVDPHLKNFRENEVALYAIMGNHEVMGRPILGEAKFQERFPDHVRTGYDVRINNMAVLMLNSNFQTLSLPDYHRQVTWYSKILQKYDEDPEVEFVITCCHHSPFTNSRVVKPSKEVQRLFVPPFIESRKSQLFLSGHAHAFEHFQVKGKDFMVIGGGGGLTQPLRKGIGTLADLAEDYKPMFHYITLAAVADHLQVRSYHLRKDFTGFEEGLKHDIKKWTETVKKI